MLFACDVLVVGTAGSTGLAPGFAEAISRAGSTPCLPGFLASGKAIAAPRTELDELLQREELDKAGVYILSGADPHSGLPLAYIGEAEVIRERLKQHKSKDFWISAIVFVSKDENLTKAHVRYLAG